MQIVIVVVDALISIHALLAESDRKLPIRLPTALISIHALLAESDYLGAGKPCDVCDFYPRSPCGERPMMPLMGAILILFLSTLSLRRATVTVLGIQHRVGISIHALLAESDALRQLQPALCRNFYPRSPCGERPRTQSQSLSAK